MKKLLTLLLIFVLVVTGCSSKKENEEETELRKTFKTAVSNLENAESLSFNVKMNFGMKKGEVLETEEITTLSKYDKNSNAYMMMTQAYEGTSITQEMYLIREDDLAHQYIKDTNGKWNYSREQTIYQYGQSETNAQRELVGYLEAITLIEELESDKEGYTLIVGTIEKDNINKVIKALGEDATLISQFYPQEDLDIYMYIKDGYIAIVEIDLSSALELFLAMTSQTEYEEPECFITYEISEYNSVKEIAVPDEVQEEVKEAYEQINSLPKYEKE